MITCQVSNMGNLLFDFKSISKNINNFFFLNNADACIYLFPPNLSVNSETEVDFYAHRGSTVAVIVSYSMMSL